MSILAWMVLGLVAGFIGSKIVNKTGEGFVLEVVLGLIEAVVSGCLNMLGTRPISFLSRKVSGTMTTPASTLAAGGRSPLTGPSDSRNTVQSGIVDMATTATDAAHAVAQAAADTVDRHRGAAAEVLAKAATSVRDGAARLPGGERVTQLAEAAGEGIDASARYVREHTAQQMIADLRQFVRRHPGAAVVSAAIVGILVGRGIRKH
jgi:uncharacterized membrane protein YeaQ/YmgE (transglycosylase-associated protein family)/ElaB/YqjD/DUF883 family membrane-anchored ribosome-binding protein